MRPTGQAWSTDLIIGVLIFLVSAGIIVSLLSNQRQEDPAPLRISSEVVATKLTQDEQLQVAPDSQLSMAQLYALAQDAQTDYQGVKDELGVQDEYCIYLRDENGNLVFIEDPANPNNKYAGVGSGNGAVNLTNQGIPCGTPCRMQADGTCDFS